MSGSDKAQFIFETGGYYCCLCLKETEKYSKSSANQREEEFSSFKSICQYLKLDLTEIFGGGLVVNVPLESLPSSVEKSAEIKGTLCSGCAQLSQQFSVLYKELQRIQRQISSCLKAVHQKILQTNQKGERSALIQLKTKFLQKSHPEALANLEIVGRLQKQIAEKCARVLPLEEEPLSEMMIILNSDDLNAFPDNIKTAVDKPKDANATKMEEAAMEEEEEAVKRCENEDEIKDKEKDAEQLRTPTALQQGSSSLPNVKLNRNRTKRFTCDNCGWIFSSKIGFNIHLAQSKGDCSELKKRTPSPPSEPPATATIITSASVPFYLDKPLEIPADDHQVLPRPLTKMESARFDSDCDKLENKRKITYHYKAPPSASSSRSNQKGLPPPASIFCNICYIPFKTSEEMNSHRVERHLKCNNCLRIFPNRLDLRQHQSKKSGSSSCSSGPGLVISNNSILLGERKKKNVTKKEMKCANNEMLTTTTQQKMDGNEKTATKCRFCGQKFLLYTSANHIKVCKGLRNQKPVKKL